MKRQKKARLGWGATIKHGSNSFVLFAAYFLFFMSISVFPTRLLSQEASPKENYEKKLLVSLKIDKGLVGDVFIDAYENIYVLHMAPSFIEVFDKTGKLAKKISWNDPYPNSRYKINVDEDGNILLDLKGDKVVSFVLDKNGISIDRFSIFEPHIYGFSSGIVYNQKDGKILRELPTSKGSLKRKLFLKDFDENYDQGKLHEKGKDHVYFPNHNLRLPEKVGNFLSKWGQLWAVTNDGTAFAFYATKPVIEPPKYNKFNPYQIRELLEFDQNSHLIGVIPATGWPFVNPDSGRVYEHETDAKNGIMKIYRWDKIS